MAKTAYYELLKLLAAKDFVGDNCPAELEQAIQEKGVEVWGEDHLPPSTTRDLTVAQYVELAARGSDSFVANELGVSLYALQSWKRKHGIKRSALEVPAC